MFSFQKKKKKIPQTKSKLPSLVIAANSALCDFSGSLLRVSWEAADEPVGLHGSLLPVDVITGIQTWKEKG